VSSPASNAEKSFDVASLTQRIDLWKRLISHRHSGDLHSLVLEYCPADDELRRPGNPGPIPKGSGNERYVDIGKVEQRLSISKLSGTNARDALEVVRCAFQQLSTTSLSLWRRIDWETVAESVQAFHAARCAGERSLKQQVAERTGNPSVVAESLSGVTWTAKQCRSVFEALTAGHNEIENIYSRTTEDLLRSKK